MDNNATRADLQRFLAEPGCAVCHCVAQSETRFFDTLLYERVNDVPFRARFRASHGLCDGHLDELLARGDPLSVAILYGDLLLVRRRQLAALRQGRRPRRMGSARSLGLPIGSPCPACATETESAERACRVLAEALDNRQLAEPWAMSPGLCWPHFVAVRTRCRAGRALLDEVQGRAFDQLAADVQALIDSFDYRSTGGRTPEVEAAGRRAAAAVGGFRHNTRRAQPRTPGHPGAGGAPQVLPGSGGPKPP